MKRTADKPAIASNRRAIFEAISAVEGIRLTAGMRETFERFDRENWTAEKRRQFIVGKYRKAAR